MSPGKIVLTQTRGACMLPRGKQTTQREADGKQASRPVKKTEISDASDRANS